MKIVIIGAGGAGLASGLKLAEMGFKVSVYEKNAFPGGLAASGMIDGMYYDFGPHIFHTSHDEINDYWMKEFGDLLEKKEFYSLNYKDGTYFEYPLSYEVINNFPADVRDKIIYELDNRKPENFKRATNFKECLVALVGPTLQEMFFEDYSRKLWGLPTEEMAASWAPKRIEIRREHKSFWYNQNSYAPIYGSGKIMDRMVENIIKHGGDVHFEHELTEIRHNENIIGELVFNDDVHVDTNESIIISTIPLTMLCELLNIETELKFTEYKLAFLVFNKDYITPENIQTIYYADEKYFFHRVTEQKKYSSIGYPEDKTLLCFEISCNEKPHIQNMDDEVLVNHVKDQFCSTGIIEEKYFEKGFIKTLPHVNPIMKTGYEGQLSHARSQISIYNNLHTVGSPAEYQYGDLQILFAKANDLVDLLTSKHYAINKNIKTNIYHSFNEEVSLYGYRVGKNNPPIIIAEIGLNHNGDLVMAKELISEAKQNGAEIAKLQTYHEDSRVSQTAKSARYADKTLDMEETTWEMFKRLKLSKEDHIELFEYARKIGIPICSTPFDERSVDQLLSLGVEAFKIASFDIVNIPFLKYVASKQKPIILSTGMSTLATVEDALAAIRSEGNSNVILLHCVSSYPASHLDANLSSINTMKTAFKVPVGYSDHTIGNTVSNAAIALGAHLIEKHFTIDTKLEGPDHVLSMDPEGLRTLTKERNVIMTALGDGIKRIMPSEYLQINNQRKSIFSNRDITKGEKIGIDDVVIKGPGHGIMPKYVDLVVNTIAKSNIKKDQPITWNDILEK